MSLVSTTDENFMVRRSKRKKRSSTDLNRSSQERIIQYKIYNFIKKVNLIFIWSQFNPVQRVSARSAAAIEKV